MEGVTKLTTKLMIILVTAIINGKIMNIKMMRGMFHMVEKSTSVMLDVKTAVQLRISHNVRAALMGLF